MPAKATAKKTSKPAAKRASAKAAVPASNGLYIGRIDLRNKSARDIRARFAAFGTLKYLRIKRSTNSPKRAYALAFYKTPEAASAAFDGFATGARSSGRVVDYAKTTPNLKTRAAATSLWISPVQFPPRTSKKFNARRKAIVAQFGGAQKVRLLREKNGAGSLVVYYKDAASASATAKKLKGKFEATSVRVRPSFRTLQKDRKRFVVPLQKAAEAKTAAAAAPKAAAAAPKAAAPAKAAAAPAKAAAAPAKAAAAAPAKAAAAAPAKAAAAPAKAAAAPAKAAAPAAKPAAKAAAAKGKK